MRSIALKLMLAFLLVGVLGAGLFAFLVGDRTRANFQLYVSDRDRAQIVSELERHYESSTSWDGVERVIRGRGQWGPPRGVTVADANHIVVAGPRGSVGKPLGDASGSQTTLIVNGKVIGIVAFATPPDGAQDQTQTLAELQFWRRVGISAWISAIATLALSALVGWLLARTLTRPLRALTVAALAMAGGKLGHTVAASGRDEIAQLARAFNKMSTDLDRSSQARKQMTADLAHDLRTPLTILSGYTEGLKDGRITSTAQIYEVMHEEVQHLKRMVEDLRTLSLADAGELVLNKRDVDPRALLERALLAHVIEAEKAGLALRIDAAQALPSLRVDTDRFAQVLDNLVSNAIAHTQRGEVVLGAQRSADLVTLSISDTGSGIASADLPHVFERFYRGDASRQRSVDAAGGSSGLGLAIARAIVEAHGGAIAVTSTVGAGSMFTITLPASTGA
jgi:two-component system, OmpR family, sensor histidine kinase BaeS